MTWTGRGLTGLGLAAGRLGAIALLALAGCASAPPHAALTIDGLSIVNQGGHAVSDVRVQVIRTGQFVSCNLIGPRGRCATTFPVKTYEGNVIEVTWGQQARRWSSGRIVIPPPQHAVSGRPVRALFTIGDRGAFRAVLTQQPDAPVH